MPCGRSHFCGSCADTVASLDRGCPMCRTRILVQQADRLVYPCLHGSRSDQQTDTRDRQTTLRATSIAIGRIFRSPIFMFGHFILHFQVFHFFWSPIFRCCFFSPPRGGAVKVRALDSGTRDSVSRIRVWVVPLSRSNPGKLFVCI